MTQSKSTYNTYPLQFWLIAVGVLVSSAGSSIVWPFQVIYINEQLGGSVTTAGSLITISTLAGLLVSFVGGFIADHIGRRPIMIISQVAHGAAYILMSRASSYWGFLFPMTLMGAAMPFYAVGSDSMMADMIPEENRANAYSLLRVFNNAGIAIGPAIGGLLVSKSYTLAFHAASAGMLAYGLFLLFFVRETLTKGNLPAKREQPAESLGGYGRVIKDTTFMRYVFVISLGMIAPLMMWTLLAVYTKENYNLPEYLYSWLPITNALMCVFVQYFVTMFTRRHSNQQMIALGMFIYAIGVGSVALMTSFWGFWLSMVLMTFGELTLIPTATTYVANHAPEDLRGRYMTFYWLTWGLARAFAPTIGGYLNDNVSPRSIWIVGLIFGLASTFGLILINRNSRDREVVCT